MNGSISWPLLTLVLPARAVLHAKLFYSSKRGVRCSSMSIESAAHTPPEVQMMSGFHFVSCFLQVLVNFAGSRVNSTRIFVLSDGQQTVDPPVEEVLPSIRQLGITVDTLAYRYYSITHHHTSSSTVCFHALLLHLN